MKRFGMFLLAALPVIAAVLIQNIVANSLALAYVTVTGNEVSQRLMYLFFVIAVFVCGVIFIYWYRLLIKNELQEEMQEEQGNELKIRLSGLFTLRNISLFVLLGIGCQFFFSGALSLLTPLLTDALSEYSEVLQTLMSGNSIVVMLLMVLVAPITEELIFRGVVLRLANRYVTFLGANLLQAVLFGVYHNNLVQGVYAAALGFLLGLVCHKYKTVFASILLHMMINAASFLLNLFPDTTVSYLIMTTAGALCTATALAVLRPFGKKSMRSEA